MKCSNGCDRKVALQGLCRRCYNEKPGKRDYFQGTVEERLAHYTVRGEPDECWLWTGTHDGHGYGLIYDSRIKLNRYAHAIAWELDRGQSIPDGQIVRHRCDTPLCVNPRHLLTGTHADNVNDKVSRERQSRGDEHGISKLTETDVEEIRRRYATGSWSQRRLAAEYGITQPNVHLIVTRKGWTHI